MELAASEDLHRAQGIGRPLVSDVERRQPVDLVAPEVDADRQVGGGGEHVDDAAPHSQLAAVLDLVLAPISGLHQPGDRLPGVEAGAGRDHQRPRRLLPGSEALQHRPHRGHHHSGPGLGRRAVTEQVPEHPQAGPHGDDLGAHPLEGQRLPGGKQRDRRHRYHRGRRWGLRPAVHRGRLGSAHRLRRQVAGEVAGQALGVGRGGGDHEQRPPVGQMGQAGQHEGLGRTGHRQRGVGASDHPGQGRFLAEQWRKGGERRGGCTGRGAAARGGRAGHCAGDGGRVSRRRHRHR